MFTNEPHEGGTGETDLGGVDRDEERGNVNMGMPLLKMGEETAKFSRNQL